MLKFSLVDITNNFQVITPIPIDLKGVTKAELTMSTFESYQLKMSINSNIGANIYKNLISNPEIGLKMETSETTLIFVRYDQTAGNFGEYDLTFLSYSTRLTSNFPQVANSVIATSNLSTFIDNLGSDEFVFELISSDPTLNFEVPQFSNLEVLKDVADGSFSWREFGLVNVGGVNKVKIQIGTFENQPLNTKFKARQSYFDDPEDLNTLLINDVKINFRGELITHLNMIGDIGGGTSSSLSLKFDDSDISADYINPLFPIVKKTKNGVTKYFVENRNARVNLKRDYYKTDTLSLNSNNEDESGGIQIDSFSAKKRMYAKSVDYLKRVEPSFYPVFDCTAKKVILPGEKINYKYKEIIDGEEIFNFNFDDVLRSVTYDLLLIRTTA